MKTRCTPPEQVLSPRDYVNRIIEVVYPKDTAEGRLDPTDVCVAWIEWRGKEVLGMRYNASMREMDNQDKMEGRVRCVGNPTSRGYPTWFIVPEALRCMIVKHYTTPEDARTPKC
jgi:hypothetical protein